MQKKNRDLVDLILGKMEYEKNILIVKRTWKALNASIEKRALDAIKLRRMGKLFGKFHIHDSFQRYKQ